jgi:predicted N-acetyltransferase YhbS
MVRLMQPSDLNAIKKLYRQQTGQGDERAEQVIERFAGMDNTYVAEENGAITACAMAVPVTLRKKKGSYLYGLCGAEEQTRSALVEFICAEQKQRGAAFLVAVPQADQFAFYEPHGFVRAFPMRCVKCAVQRNLWSQAEFDTVTAKRLCELRQKFCPNSVCLDAERMAIVMSDLYARGMTIVANDAGYGVYFRKDETLYFMELMANDDRAAATLMEAAREKEVIVERAVISLGASQQLFAGDGNERDYGMIRFLGEPFDVETSYMRLMMEH